MACCTAKKAKYVSAQTNICPKIEKNWLRQLFFEKILGLHVSEIFATYEKIILRAALVTASSTTEGLMVRTHSHQFFLLRDIF